LSLVELLIASIVVAVAGTLLAGGLVTSNRGAARRFQQILATQLLASRVALLDDHVAAASGELSGTFPSPLEAFHWTQRWESVADSMARLTIAVSDGTATTHVVTYRPIVEEQ
jgi:type II secretory pathway pseudopilin PulG